MEKNPSLSFTEENYLKSIYHLGGDSSNWVNTNSIAENLNTKASSVTDMVKKLNGKKLITHKKYYGVKLSEKGRITAVNIVRKHRLWEVFLVDKLGFKWDEVHDIAEQLEHIQSRELIRRLDGFLGFPKRDPHGDPIPDVDGKIKEENHRLLSEMEKSEKGLVSGVRDSSVEFLQHLDRLGINLGTEVVILGKNNYDDSIETQIKGKSVFISKKAAENIWLL